MPNPEPRISRGEIWLITPVGLPKPRPALVVSINAINDLLPDVLVVPFTTKPGPLRVQIEEPPETSGLKTTTFAKCETLGPVHKSRLKRRIGHLSDGCLGTVEQGIKRVMRLA